MRERAWPVWTAALSLLGLGTAVVAAQHPHGAPEAGRQARTAAPTQELKVGKSDDVEFAAELRVGDVTLKPGKYRLRHRVEGADHSVRFEALLITTPSAQKLGTGLPVPAGVAGEVRCRLEPLGSTARGTTLFLMKEAEGGPRLTKILIKGESVAHVF